MGGYYVGKPPGKVEMIFAIETGEYLLHPARVFFCHTQGIQLIFREIFPYEKVDHHFLKA